jgi:hypothetical protein
MTTVTVTVPHTGDSFTTAHRILLAGEKLGVKATASPCDEGYEVWVWPSEKPDGYGRFLYPGQQLVITGSGEFRVEDMPAAVAP